MRRSLVLALGLLEFLAALVLFVFAWRLPGPEVVRDGAARAERLGRQTSAQVRVLKDHLAALRERQPQLQEVAAGLRKQVKTLATQLEGQRIDPVAVQIVRDALGDVSRGLEGLSETLDPKALGRVAEGLGAAAEFLDEKLVPAAASAAKELDRSTLLLKEDAERLAKLLRQAPLDLKVAKEVHDSLGGFGEGLERLESLLKPERLKRIKEGFQGLEESLGTGAEQVDRLASYYYPVVKFDGLKPKIEEKPFWPDGATIATGMRKAAKGATAAAEEVGELATDAPKLQKSLRESQKVVVSTREALGQALKQQDQIEALLKNVPDNAARLAEALPRLGADLSSLLRDTARMKEVGGLLRQAQKGVEKAVDRWPTLNRGLMQSAKVLRATQEQLDQALTNRDQLEAAVDQTLKLTRSFADLVPLLTTGLEEQVRQQDEALEQLVESVDGVTEAMPGYANMAGDVLQMARVLLALMGGVFALHGLSLLRPQ